MSDQIQVLSRAFVLLDILSRQGQPLSLAQIAQQAALPKSTTHRLLAALAYEGFVISPQHGHYTLGNALICLSARALRGGIAKYLGTSAKDLRERTRHTVYVGAIHGFDILYLHKEPGDVAPFSNVGDSGSAVCSSLGRVILAYKPWEEVKALVDTYGFNPRTEFSLRDMDALRNDLQLTRGRGYSRVVNEFTLGVSTIAAPIFNHEGGCSLAISLVVVGGTSSVDVEEYAFMLTRAAKEISERMGYVEKGA